MGKYLRYYFDEIRLFSETDGVIIKFYLDGKEVFSQKTYHPILIGESLSIRGIEASIKI